MKSLTKNKGYANPGASIEDIKYFPDRKLDMSRILRLVSCAYIQEAHKVILVRAIGTSKTYLVCALDMAVKPNSYNAKYLRVPDLSVEIAIVRSDGTFQEYMKKLNKTKLLILYEWLLLPLKECEARDVLESVEARAKTPSTNFALCLCAELA